MRETVIDALLAALAASAWLGCFGFARLRAPLDRVHCITFVNAVCGVALLGAALTQDGFSDRCCKVILITVLNLLNGAAISHVTGRAIRWRSNAS